MAKQIKAQVKLQIPAGKANPSPPVGPALGQQGINIMEFCKAFNAKTKDMGDTVVPVIITVYQDRSFTFITKTPPTSVLVKKALKLKSGSSAPQKDKVGKLTAGTGQANCRNQIARPELFKFRGSRATGGGHGQKHGHSGTQLGWYPTKLVPGGPREVGAD